MGRRYDDDEDDRPRRRRRQQSDLPVVLMVAGAGLLGLVVIAGIGVAVLFSALKPVDRAQAEPPTVVARPNNVSMSEEAAPKPPAAKPAPEVISLAGLAGSQSLLDAYANNEANGDAKFGGRVVELQYAGEVRKAGAGYQFLGIDRPNGYSMPSRGIFADPRTYVRLVIDLRPDQVAAAAKIERDQQVIIRAKVVGQKPHPSGRGGVAVYLTDGVVVSRLRYNQASSKYEPIP